MKKEQSKTGQTHEPRNKPSQQQEAKEVSESFEQSVSIKEDTSPRGRGDWSEQRDASERGQGTTQVGEQPSKRGEGGWDGYTR